MKKVAKIPVHEIFGPTIQGEGMVVGQKTMFIRTGGCDYSCSWCDSSFTWDGSRKATMMTPQEIVGGLMKLGTPTAGALNFNHVTISGGNPALWGDPMAQVISMLQEEGIKVGLETQGSRFQEWMHEIDDLTISPKPPSSGMVTNWEALDDVVSRLAQGPGADCGKAYSLKVVIFDEGDMEYAHKVYSRYVVTGMVPREMFYVSVGNSDAAEEGDISGRLLKKLSWLWDQILADPRCNDWKPLPQLHTLVWHNKPGV